MELPITREDVTTAVSVAGYRLHLQARFWQFRLPFAAFIWGRPLRVTVETGETSVTHPIRDATRRALWLIYGGGTAVALLIWLLRNRN
jgi:hypothetical protein